MPARKPAAAWFLVLMLLSPMAAIAQSQPAATTDRSVVLTLGAPAVELGDRLHSEDAGSQIEPSAKSPFLAGFLSFLIPGAGQLYNGQATKGLVHLALGVAAAGMTYQGFAGDGCQEWSETYWDAFSEAYRTRWVGGDACGWGYAGIGLSAATRIWSAYDGAASAGRLNAGANRVAVAMAVGPKRVGAIATLRF